VRHLPSIAHPTLTHALHPFWWYLSSMSAATLTPPLGFDDLSVDQQIEYVQSLWDRIVLRSEDVPVPAWHRDELDARIADHEANPDAGQPWEDVERELRAELRASR
jgi:putative addiction module component (TIGR02574 family)